MNQISMQKKLAAEYAVDKFVSSNMILGLGTGSTAIFALNRIAERLENGEIENVTGIPSSRKTEEISKKLGIPITTLNEHKNIDVTIDGADEVDPDMNLIKGGGGALLREKIIAQASEKEVIIVDESKLSSKLGANWPVPIEVIPFGWKSHADFFSINAGTPFLRLTDSGEPFTTDHGNYIVDVNFGIIEDVASLSKLLESRVGIVEHGLFINLATDLVVANEQGIRHTTK